MERFLLSSQDTALDRPGANCGCVERNEGNKRDVKEEDLTVGKELHCQGHYAKITVDVAGLVLVLGKQRPPDESHR